jgi:amino acid adenylation domain-containing protein
MDLSSRIAGLTSEKRALLARWLEKREREDLTLPPLQPRLDRDSWPLSFGQERLWFLQRWAPESSFYNGHVSLRVTGPLSPAPLSAAVDEVCRRHEVLRATFSEVNGEPVQRVAPFAPPYLWFVDLSGLPPELRSREGGRISGHQATRPFDLEREQILRAVLLREEAGVHDLLLTMHHVATDAWSWGLLLREIATLYRCQVAGLPSPLPELPVQYADYAAWQRERLQGEALEREIAFWRETLRGVPPALELPTDRPRPAVPTLRGASEIFHIPPAVTERLRGLADHPGRTLFMVLLTAFQGLLGRLTGQADVVVGTPVAGRQEPATHDLIGVFINLLALRVGVADDPPFPRLLDRVQQATVEAFSHQDLPFERLVEELRPSRESGLQPLFQVLLVVQEAARELPVIPGLKLSSQEAASAAARYDWVLTLTPGPEGISGSLDYATDLFDSVTIRRILGHFSVWLTALAESPERRLSDLPLLTGSECRQLAEWNDTAVDRSPEMTLDALLRERAALEPGAVAVVCDKESLTYGELSARAASLAARLRRLGVGPEVRVGICAERSPELVVGLLAILEAGGAYVPLDPSYPAERLTFLLEDSRVPVLLTQDRLRPLLGDQKGIAVLCLDASEADARVDPVPLAWRAAGPDNLAYVIYTSGSTGRPKGAMNTHRAIVNRLLWMQETFGLSAGDRVLQKTPFSFDVSVWEFFWPLLVGARLVLARPEGHKDPVYLIDLIRAEKVTTLHFVPSMLQAFLATEGVEECRTLRTVVASGEALPPDLVARFLARLGPLGAELHNLYGPTEAAVDVTAHPCRPGDELRPVPIGRPISNCTLHILDAFGREAPMGVAGELLLGGVQLARGYLGRPELTAERFVPDPIGMEPGARLYRTGDLARYRSDGTAEFLGRLDHQVKVRGFRIELPEIELALAAHPDVREVVVVARGQGLDQRLVAYIVPVAEGIFAAGELRRFLVERLPEHMVPTAWVTLPALPLSPNGKVDRAVLPAPELSGGGSRSPRTPVEEMIAGIWGEVLRLETVGAEESFFDLGGHSLIATQVVARLRDAFGVEMPLHRFFQAPTVAEQAAFVATARTERSAAAIVPVPHQGRAPLSFAQERLWFIHRLEPASPAYNLAVALRIRGALNEAALAGCFAEIVRRHETLRTTFALDEGRVVQRIVPPEPGMGGAVLLPIVDLAGLPKGPRAAELRHLAAAEAGRPFDLAVGPLLRLVLLRLGEGERALFLTMHHIVSDGWSMALLVEETAAVYPALAAGRPSPLAPLPIQYADFAMWQRDRLRGEALAAQLDWWREQLAGAPPALELPTDRPRPPVQTFRGASLERRLPTATARHLRALARQESATLFMVLLAAFAELLRRFSGQEDLVVGAPIANRTRPELEGLIGFFINSLPLRCRLAEEEETTLRGLVAQTRRTSLGAYAHQDLPFERLVEELQLARDLSRHPVFQVVLALQNMPVRSRTLPDLALEAEEVEGRTAKFDWTLFVEERPDGPSIVLEYDRDLFEAVTAERVLAHFEHLLEAAAEPELRLSAVSSLAMAERQQLLAEWNDTAAFEPASRWAHEQVLRQAAASPAAPAVVVSGGEVLTYGELARRARRLAAFLQQHGGVGPEVLVGLCLERSADLIVAMLATWTAGGAYLPLDSSHPRERLQAVLEDARCHLLLTHRGLLSGWEGPCLDLDRDKERIESQRGEAMSVPLHAESLAYVIYTSGSTGRPKGVAVPHGGLANLIAWHRALYPSAPSDRMSQLASPAFDASVWEIWPPLASGASLHLPDAEVRVSAPRLAAWLADEGMTCAFAPTPLAERLLHEDWPPSCRLRVLLTGGDTLHLRPAPGVGFRLVNHYGPTEGSVVATASPVPSDTTSQPPPIGRPIANVQVHVVDRRLELVPSGAPGELLIGGAGLARGYLYRPELTAERFIPDPWSALPGARLYRTGDLVRWLPQGELLFLGRTDRQVKIRGVRIEPGEVEAALVRLPGIWEAAVVLRDDPAGERLLVAYVVSTGQPPTATEVQELLRPQLPASMIPAAVVVLEALPLTTNGKVDHRALPAPRRSTVDGQPFGDPVEELVAGIWADVLRLERVGAHDDFFALGGHSLLAAQVMSRIRGVLDVELPLRTLFEASTLVELARAIRESREGRSAPPIVPVPRDPTHELPVSFAQQRLWVIDQLEPGNVAYNIPSAVRLSGAISAEELTSIFSEIVRRHEALRTTFTTRDGEPVQVITPARGSRVHLPVVDLSHLRDGEREPAALALAREAARLPFDLRSGPLLRLLLVRLAEREHLLLLDLHHIVADGWSMGVLLREVAALADALAEGRPSSLPELPVQYADYAVWQRSWLQGEILAEQLDFWKRQLAGAPTVLELPLDRPRPDTPSYRGASCPALLPTPLSGAVRELCQREGATPFMVLLAAWAVLLGRHAGQEDVLLGSPIAGRIRQEIEGLIGLFLNTLVLRSSIPGVSTFSELLGRVRHTALDAFSHQDLPFERIVEEVVTERNLTVSPLFQVMFILQNAPQGELAIPGLLLSPVEVEAGRAKFDLTLGLGEGPSGFSGALEYSTDLFDRVTAERLLARWVALLEAAAGDPDLRLADLPILLPAERLQLLEWNATGTAPVSDRCLHELVAAQAERTPHEVALVHGTERLTYLELVRRAGGLALRLRELGAGPEIRVAVCLERSPDLIATLIGVLASGGAYVPIDPTYPAERRALMLEDSGAAVLVTRERFARDLAAARVIDLDAEEIPAAGGLPERDGAGPDHLAYLIYTSGSTGRPKGVAIEHRSAVALVSWARREFSDDELAGVLAATSVCFDLSVFEIFVPLALGGRVILADNALALPTLPAANEVRLLNAVPSAVTGLVRLGVLPRSVLTVCLAGEPLPAALAESLYDTGTVERVLNLYGPSEDTTYSTGALVPRDGGRAPAIGRPIQGTRAWVVDPQGSLVPPGVAGELWLAGAGLARGYLGRPELTAERFMADPFGAPGERAYRTGDLVRLRPDGELEFLGRIDHQVKVRGFRIELGEIEEALRRHPAVRECVLLARGDGPDSRRLMAYVAGSALEPAALHDFLSARLPDYMVPSAFVILDMLPLTPNGKVDRKALPTAESGRVAEDGPVASFGPIEELLVGIWSEVLGLERFGRHESFFALGGHSLLATRVVSRLREVLGVELPLRRLFEAPTLEGLAREVEAARRREEPASAPPIVPVRCHAQDLPLSFAQQRLWFLDQLAPESPAYNIPLAVQLNGVLRQSVLEAAFHEVVRRHEALRTSFLSVCGQPVQTIAEQATVPLPLVDLEALGKPAQDGELRRLVRAEALRAFDLSAGPLIRTTLVRLEPRRHAVLVTMHHVVSDGWSLGVLLGELGMLYTAFSEGRSSPLAELAIQYADYAIWQRTWLSGERLEAEIAWWKHELAGVPATLELPADRPRPLRQSFRGGVWPVSLAPEFRKAMVSLGRGVGATPFMVILALFQSLLARWSGQEDFLVGTPIAGRTRAETEPLIGFFVNTLALRSDLTGEPSLRMLLGRVREIALDAYAHQEIPFERLVEELQPERDLGRPALVQALLALQNTPVTESQVRELTFLPLEVEGETAKLDLSLHLSEEGDWIRGRFTYSTDLFEAATVARLAERFRRLLDCAVADPDRRLSDIPLLSPAEWHQLAVEPGGVPAPADERCIHDLFAEQARRSPEALAVLGEDGELTYADLGRRARRLSLRLRAAGVGPDQPVILQAERGVALVVGLLGILESGGAYLAVDPDLPQARLELLAGDSHAVVAVTQRGLSSTLPGGLRRVFLEDLEEDGPDLPELPRAAVLPGHLAYVLYTSGSTGRPKGVMVEHRQLAAYIRGVVERLAVPEGASFASVSSFAADLGNTSIFVALLGGGCLHVVPRERLADAAAMADWMESHPVDGLKIVPSHLAALLTAERPERLLPRRRLVLGGEALPWKLVERVRALAPECRLFNHYGPTETTVGVLAGEAVGEGSAPSAPLGRPLGPTRAWVVDRRQRLSPLGVPGELCVGGPQVTRGYLGRPDLTAERFIPDPFSGVGERLYRTGDLVRQRPDGIEFLGRTDDQVKIRGFRIELPEIESALLALPGVREAAALVRQKGDDRSLCAFVAVEPGTTADASALLARLRTQLPAALVPSELAFVETLPRTSNGKIDRQALASATAGLAVPELLPFAGDTDSVTRIIAAIWEEVLGLPRVRPHDDFFAIGGHSLLATRVCSRIREACAVELPLRSLFEAGTPERLAAAVRGARRGAAGRSEPPIVPVPRGQDFPLSFAQQRLWLLAQIEPDSPAYNIPMAVRLLGRLDVPALVAALRSIEQRHEVLRTTFTLIEGRPVQRAGMAPCLELPVVDLLALPAKTRQEEFARLARAEALCPFNLAAGPVWRGGLVRLAEQEHGVLITLHHIASDGWSRGILLREIGDLYSSVGALPALPVQYADFAVWQRDWLQEDVLRDQLDYWRRQLSGAPRALELSFDRPRPAMRTFRGATQSVTLSPELSREIKALCHREGATPFMGLLAAWAVLLGRHANQQDVLVGSPIAGRGRREVEALIGCFINTLVLRTDFSGAPDFCALLRRVRAMALEAYSHQDLPFERLVEELVTERDLALTPLFQTLFVLQNTPAARFFSPGLSMEPVEVAGTVAKFDLSLSLTETQDAILGSLEYDTDLFDASTVQRLLARWTALLEEAIAQPSVPLTDLSLLLPAERQQVLEDWNDTGAAPLSGLCLHELFMAQSTRTPEAVALLHGTGQWSYAELAARAGGMARRLLALGIGPEARVAVCLERSPDLITSLLGVLASGGAYVPIDPAYPVERRALMLEDSAAAVLVTRGRLSKDLPETGARVLDLDVEEIPAADGLPVGLPVLPENLAYLIYTSGSTGRPKGVAIEHRSAVALAGWARNAFSAEELTGMLAATSVCFDLSVFEIFVPLAWGGRILLAENALELPSLPCSSAVRLLNTVPSVAAELVRGGNLPPNVRTVNLAGEPLPAALAARLYATGTVERVLNLYGPSEDTTYSTGTLVARDLERTPAIGRPLPGTRTYVVDHGGQPVPVMVAGELWLAGAGLARGYLGRPGLTAERFTPDPFGEPGARVYRTGDLARFRPDGELEFLGRIDQQVKVRGFRIELGEVEAALASHPAVDECVCMVRDASLVAWVAGELTADELRVFLGRRLPEYMIPASFIFLEALPQTPNGKIDRAALAVPSQPLRPDPHGGLVHPRDVVELALVRLWEEVLEVRPLGVRDDFFSLGGHSLLAVRLIARIRQELGETVPLARLFDGRTVERMADLLRHGAPDATARLVTLQPGQGAPLIWIHPAGGGVFCYLELLRHLPGWRSYGFMARGLDGPEPPLTSVDEMAALYLRELRALQPDGPYRLVGWSMGGLVAFEMARRLSEQGAEVTFLGLLDARVPTSGATPAAFDESALLQGFAQDLGLSRESLDRASGAGEAGSDDFLYRLLGEACDAGLVPPDFGLVEARRRFEIFRVHAAAGALYRPRTYPGSVTLFRATDMPSDDRGPDLGWGEVACGGVIVHDVPGTHFTLVRGPHARTLARHLAESFRV